MIESNFDIQADLVENPASTFFMRVGSDAMIASGIEIGDKLVVDKAINPKHKDIVVAAIGGQFLVRRLYSQGGKLELRSENDNCQAIPLIGGLDEIWGVVTGVVRKY